MIIKFEDFNLLERNLNIELLNREGEEWWDTFIDKLRMNDTFTLSDTKRDIRIKNRRDIINNITDEITKKVDLEKAYRYFTEGGRKGGEYKKIIKTSDDKFIALNDLERTKEFGSGPGTSTGTIQTRKNETVQAICLSIRQEKGSVIDKDDVMNFVKKYRGLHSPYVKSIISMVGTQIDLDEQDLIGNEQWVNSHIELANAVFDYIYFNKKMSIFNKKKHYAFHQSFFNFENQIPKILKERFYILMRDLLNMNVDTEKLRVNFAKWNPADVFIINTLKEKKIINKINKCKNLVDLTKVVDKYFETGDLIGLSLKKIESAEKINLIVNNEEKSLFKYVGASTSRDPFKSMSVYFISEVETTIKTSKQQVITSRLYSGKDDANIQLEIKGLETKYGKININYVNYLLSSMNMKRVPRHQEIDNSSEELMELISSYYKKLSSLLKYTDTDEDRFDISNKRNKLIAKYQSLILADILEENKNIPYENGYSKTNYVVEQLFYYGYAMNNHLFDTTKYFRINVIR